MSNIIVNIRDNLSYTEYRNIIRDIININYVVNVDYYEEKSNIPKLIDELAIDLYKLRIKHLKERIELRDRTIERLKRR